jgi:hypothetical protein
MPTLSSWLTWRGTCSASSIPATSHLRPHAVIGKSGKTLRTTIVSFSPSWQLLDGKRANALH